MELDDPELIADFLVEAEEHLDEIDQILLELESDPENEHWVMQLTGRFHTLKGMASYIDFHELQQLCHLLESILAFLHTLTPQSHQQCTDLTFEAVNAIRQRCAELSSCVSGGQSLPASKNLARLIGMLETVSAQASQKPHA